MKVTETGDRMVFFVASESVARRVYRVSLLEHEGRSECSCPHWRTSAWPLIRDGEPITNPDTRCKHVSTARAYFLNSLLATMAEAETQPLAR